MTLKHKLFLIASVFALTGFSAQAEAIRGSYGNKSPAAVLLELDESSGEVAIEGIGWFGGPSLPRTFEEEITKAFKLSGPQVHFTHILQQMVAVEAELGGIFPRYAYVAIPESFLQFQASKGRFKEAKPWLEFIEANKHKFSRLEFYRLARNGRILECHDWQEYFNILFTDPPHWPESANKPALHRAARRIAGNFATYESGYFYKQVVSLLKKQLAEEKRKYERDPSDDQSILVKELNEELLFYIDQRQFAKDIGNMLLRQVDYLTLLAKCPGYTPDEVLAEAARSPNEKNRELAIWVLEQMQETAAMRVLLSSPYEDVKAIAEEYLSLRGEQIPAGARGVEAVAEKRADLAPLKPGVAAEYYSGMAFDNKKVSRIEGQINIWSAGPFASFPQEVKDDKSISAVWQGKLNCSTDGDYAFYVNTYRNTGRPFKGPAANYSYDPYVAGLYSGGSRLFIDGKEVMDNWEARGPIYFTHRLPLSKGLHDIRLEYHSRELQFWDAGARLYWSCAGEFEQEIVPARAFYHDSSAKIVLSPDASKKASSTGRQR
ncbi:hypothetical protein ACFL1X_06635 [Candidatus Hydrogenedentota bacterium]